MSLPTARSPIYPRELKGQLGTCSNLLRMSSYLRKLPWTPARFLGPKVLRMARYIVCRFAELSRLHNGHTDPKIEGPYWGSI